MNDIYEYKARKYKYKYLKLKYIAEGGVFEKIRNKLGYNLGFNSIMTPIDKSKPIDHTQSASSEQKKFKQKLTYLRSNIKIHLEPYPNTIYGNINYEDTFHHLENGNYIKTGFNNFGLFSDSEYAGLIIDNNRRIIFHKNDYININITDKNKNYYMSYICDNIFNTRRGDYIQRISYAPPILKFFFDIYKSKRTAQENILKQDNKNNFLNDNKITITKEELFDELKNIDTPLLKFETDLKDSFNKPSNSELDEIYIKLKKPTMSLKIFKDFVNFFKENFFKEKGFKDKYFMKDIFDSIIVKKENPYIKNIDYYSLAMIIYTLYTTFTNFFSIVEDTTKSSERLPELFENLKKQYNDNEIVKVTFLEQLDLIISVIKE